MQANKIFVQQYAEYKLKPPAVFYLICDITLGFQGKNIKYFMHVTKKDLIIVFSNLKIKSGSVKQFLLHI